MGYGANKSRGLLFETFHIGKQATAKSPVPPSDDDGDAKILLPYSKQASQLSAFASLLSHLFRVRCD